VHDKGVIGSNLEKAVYLVSLAESLLTEAEYLQWDLTCPDCEIACIVIAQFTRHGGDMVYQAKFLEREELRRRCWVEVEIREGKVPSSLPAFNLSLDLWGP